MLDIVTIRQKMQELRCCVIIPTYNNDRTLTRVIRDVEDFTEDIIVVNDGSTDRTPEILAGWPNEAALTVITIPHNRGKGWALRQGFRNAIEKGFRYAITIDSDGQHYAEDIPKFMEKAEIHPDSLVIGARDMEQEYVPGGSSFGHRFSIFWFRIETGLRVPDVQSGYRLYPLEKVHDIRHFYSTRYEFEVEAMVRLAWRGIRIDSVPVGVYYAPKGERVSHFRKIPDFARTSLLNIILVFAALLWVRPFHFARELRKKSFRDFLREHILESKDSNAKIAWSVTLGIFIGVLPVWGWQMLVAVSLAYLFKLNKFVALAASNISIPPMLPVILFLSFIAGGWVLGSDISGLRYDSGINLQWIKQNLIQYLVGSLVFGAVFAPAMGITTLILLKIFRKNR